MPDTNLILSKLESQEKAFNKMDSRLTGIEKAVVNMALQKKDIDYLTMQNTALTKRFDNLYASDGAITKLQDCANNCPKSELKSSLNKLWGALALIIALIGALKIWG